LNIQELETIDGFYKLQGASDAQIADAQACLGVTFAPEYMEYLKMYGAVAIDGVMLTGISESSENNVVDVTVEAREFYKEVYNYDIPANLYVIDDTGADHIMILQDETGIIYELSGYQLTQVAASLVEFIIDELNI
jgi:hypothetical protein